MAKKSIQLLTAATATNSPPSGASAGAETNSLKVGGNIPDSATVIVQSTAGSGTMTVTIKMWGYSSLSATWLPMGPHATAASKGLLNDGNAIPEGPESNKIQHAEVLTNCGHFERIYAEITAIGGTATAVSCWVVTEDVLGG